MRDLSLNLAGDYIDGTEDDIIHVEHGDFAIRGGKFSLIPDDDVATQLGQRLHVRLLLRRGEVFFNTSAGFPYVDISKFKRNSDIFNTYMKSYILETNGVLHLESFSSSLDNSTRVENVNFSVTTQEGNSVTISQELTV
ncbi:hypothetical protein [Pectobacterium phage Wc4-1]|uniref:Uncharacterized protein n=2 Tax=Arnovirus TaxID=3425109 RepID=A0A5P8D4A5_9CAUD|nr:hypothetical protein Arno162_94 [Pectobacterium phage Arno162]QFP93855.1 hypothetical protein [Pectobacterium phage Wc4]QFP94000.1 hypothetical protein [Pectobacterium phage Wc4-1]